jgi:hypothetical protein
LRCAGDVETDLLNSAASIEYKKEEEIAETREENTNLARYSPDGVSFGRVVVSWEAP